MLTGSEWVNWSNFGSLVTFYQKLYWKGTSGGVVRIILKLSETVAVGCAGGNEGMLVIVVVSQCHHVTINFVNLILNPASSIENYNCG